MNKYLLYIIIIGFGLRFFLLDSYPIQLNHDEVSQIYDAISITQTGRDIYGKFLPFIFESIHDFKPPFYIYITGLFVYLFGNNEVVIRLPAAIFGTLLIPAVYFFTKELFKARLVALSAALLTAISPFEIFFSRKSFEGGIGVFLSFLGFSLLLKAINSKKFKLLFFSLLSLSVGMYTYFSHTLTIPFLLLAFSMIYRKKIFFLLKKTGFAKLITALVVLAVILSPLLFFTLTNKDTRFRSQTVFISQDPNLTNLKNLSDSSQPISSLLKNMATLSFINNRYLEQLNPLYLFGNGLDLTHQGILGSGPLFLSLLPFLILGIIDLLKSDFNKERVLIFVWILISLIPSGVTFERYSPHRVLIVFSLLNILSALGIRYFLKLVQRLNSKVLKLITYNLAILILTFNCLYFLHIYFINFPFEKSQSMQYPFKEVAQFASAQKDSFDQVIFDPLFGEDAPVIGAGAQYYLSYYGNVPPSLIQSQFRLGNRDREVLFDKFSIRKFDWLIDQNLQNVLVIASPWSLPIKDIDPKRILKVFYFYNHKIAFYAVAL